MLKKTNKSSNNRRPDRVPDLSIHEVDLVTRMHLLLVWGDQANQSNIQLIFVVHGDDDSDTSIEK
jgi:hypothetical protein